MTGLIVAAGVTLALVGLVCGKAAGDLDKKGEPVARNLGLGAMVIFTVAGCLLIWGA